MFKVIVLALFILFAISKTSFAQTTYPRVAVYVGVIHPIVTYSSDPPQYNFKDYYVVGMPIGFNYWKSKTIGLSFEFVPFIRAENGTSKMSNFLFHPGVLVPLGHGYTFAGRAAFETSGRYGFTPVFNKVIKKNKGSSYYIAVPLPVRFGNDRPNSFTVAFQFGIAF